MTRVRVTASSLVAATPATVYGVLADYRGGHSAILPPRHFSDLTVERGGLGAGTVIRFRMRAAGATRAVRAEVTEPEPGRVIEESDLATGAVTRFVVEPVGDGAASHVTIVTEWATPGVRGWIERLLAPPMLRRIYEEELRRLAEVAARPHEP